MKKKLCVLSALLLALFAVTFTSCDLVEEQADINVNGKIYYGTGTYGTVNYIEYTVTGGKGPYKIYFAKSIGNWDYAKSQRSYIDTVEDGVTYRLTPAGTNYVTTGWYYYIWAVDKNGASGGSRWHP